MVVICTFCHYRIIRIISLLSSCYFSCLFTNLRFVNDLSLFCLVWLFCHYIVIVRFCPLYFLYFVIFLCYYVLIICFVSIICPLRCHYMVLFFYILYIICVSLFFLFYRCIFVRNRRMYVHLSTYTHLTNKQINNNSISAHHSAHSARIRDYLLLFIYCV